MNTSASPVNKAKNKKMLLKTKEELIARVEEQDKRIQYLEELITEKITENQAMLEKLQKLKEKQKKQNTTSYNKETSWVGKIITALTAKAQPLQASGIIRYIEENDKEIFKKVTTKSKHLSPNLVKAVKYGRIKKYKIKGVLGHFYALPQWFDENGNLKKEYKEKEPIA